MGKEFTDPDCGLVSLRKNSRSRRVSLRVRPDGSVLVTLPTLVPYKAGVLFFLSKKDWVMSVRERYSRMEKLSRSGDDDKALMEKGKRELPLRLAELASAHGFRYNEVRIKRNRSNWGSCSRKGNINLNVNLVRVPEELRDYVMLHELCHLRHFDHGPAFHDLLESLCPDHRAKSRKLREFRLA